MNKSFHIITFGCQMNEHDSERIAGILEKQGCHSSACEDADIIVLNTCSIREKAEQKFYSELGRIKKYKIAKPELIIVAAGCIAQQEGKAILSRAPYVDVIIGTSDLEKLPELIEKRFDSCKPAFDVSGDPDYHIKRLPALRNDGIKAWVSIMYGCNNFCSYCVVPYVRGRERSRPSDDIVNEVRQLAEKGYKEVTLLGQNVNSYGNGCESPVNFPSLLKLLNNETDITRIRFVTSHPRDLSEELISAIRDLSKVCESLHLPVQSGSNTILHAMNRRYSREEYLDKVSRLRQEVPGITLSTDIIVGFPGETEKDFLQTMKLLEEVHFDSIFAFKYSQRPQTAACKYQDDVEQQIKEKRLHEVLALQKNITFEQNKRQIGTVQEVLVDGQSKKGVRLSGRTRGNKVVNFEAPSELIGNLVHVSITKAGMNSLTGDLIIKEPIKTDEH